MTVSEKLRLDEVIALFPSFAVEGLGKTHLLSHEIDVGDQKPVKQRHYPVSPAVQSEMYAEIDRMLELEVIEESSSPWCSPMAIVRKKNGKTRLCLDARKLNEATKKDAYPLPFIEGLLSRLDSTRYISAIDLKDAFWQIPLAENSKECTAFAIPGRPLYQFRVMPFGLCNAPQTLCRLMDRVIPHQLHDKVFVYLDDLLITTSTFEEHLQILKEVASRLKAANLTINVEKSKFNLREVEYLGYVVGGGSLRVNPNKVGAIADFPRPTTVKQLRRFLGMTGWYRRFIPGYSTISAPLTDLLKKSVKLAWSEPAELAFNSLKSSLISAPVLRNPDFKKRFYIQCDASLVGIGAVLFQKDDEGEDYPIAFFSQKLNGAQRNYSVTELECLAAVRSIKKFRAYVEKLPFTVITDHASLQWLRSQKDLSGRLARWSLKLQGFDFEIEHCAGTRNKVPDALSRSFTVDEIVGDGGIGVALDLDLNNPAFLDPEYISWMNSILKLDDVQSNLRVLDGKIFIHIPSNPLFPTDIPGWKLVIPSPLIRTMIERAHCPPNSAHQGVSKTLDYLKRWCYWKGMFKDIAKYVGSCVVCQTCKAPNFATRPLMGKHVEVTRPFQYLYLDFLGPYPRSKAGRTHILILLDKFTRFVICRAVRQATAAVVVDLLKEVFNIYGVPESILTDNGKQFESIQLAEFLKKFDVTHTFTPKYSPQSNLSERVNRSLLAVIRAYLNGKHQDWDIHLPDICSALNNTKHDSTKFSPQYLVFGQHRISHASQYKILRQLDFIDPNFLFITNKAHHLSSAQMQVLENLDEAHKVHASRYNLRARPHKFVVGQKVLYRNFTQSSAVDKISSKLSPKYSLGTIKEPVGSVAYKIQDEREKL